MPRQQHDHRQNGGHPEAHPHRDPDALADPVILAGAEVLADEGGDGDAEGVADHPEEGVDLAVGGPAGNGIGAEAVDGRLDQDVGDGVEGRLETDRDADPQHRL